MRFMGYTLAAEVEGAPPPQPGTYEAMGQFVEEAFKAGVLVATGGIGPTAMGARVSLKDGEYTVVDGPFTEAKEVLGGYAILEARDREHVLELTHKFLDAVGQGTCELHELFVPPQQ